MVYACAACGAPARDRCPECGGIELFDQISWYRGQPQVLNPFPPALAGETFDEYIVRMATLGV